MFCERNIEQSIQRTNILKLNEDVFKVKKHAKVRGSTLGILNKNKFDSFVTQLESLHERSSNRMIC